ncbi:MAG: S8 family serine peptidase [Clostridia bacterium]
MNAGKKCAILLTLLLTICGSTVAAKADRANSRITDYSDCLGNYARAVAQAVSGKSSFDLSTPKTQNALPGNGAILFRTDGTAPDLSRFKPQKVLRGTRNCYTALFLLEEDAQICVEWLKDQPYTIYAEMNGIVTSCDAVGNNGKSPYLSWGAEAMGAGMLRDFVQDNGKGSQLIAVVDSGTYRHVLVNPKIKKLGFDYIDIDRDPTNDGYGHGTHVSGIIADCTARMPVYLMPIRVLDNGGNGVTANLVNAIGEAVEAGADVINISITAAIHSEALDDAVTAAVSAGVTVVLAAGNNACNTARICPAHLTLQGAIVVGSVEQKNGGIARASYSNYGNSVDVSAFGTNIYSCANSGGYITMSGTSMAAPHISAAVGAIRLVYGLLSPAAVERKLQSLVTVSPWDIIGCPSLSGLVPQSIGVHANALVLHVGDVVDLEGAVLPVTAQYPLIWSSGNATVAEIDASGLLTCVGKGETVLRVECAGVLPKEIALTVVGADMTMLLPAGLKEIDQGAFMNVEYMRLLILANGMKTIGTEAFAGCTRLQTIRIPSSVIKIGENAFLGAIDAVLLCEEGSAAQQYALDYKMDYLLMNEEYAPKN